MARVLVVEDSPTQASDLRFLLEDAGFRVDLAVDGVEALELLDAGLPDLIVTDMLMPRMDGLELLEAVKRKFPSVPVVIITAHGSEEIAARALRSGAASYVPKRYLGQDLAHVAQQIVAMAAPDPDQGRIMDALDQIHLRFTLANDGTLVAPLVRRLEKLVLEMGLCDRPELIRLAVALSEAIVNAIDHGNLELDSELRQEDERIYHRLGEERQNEPPYRDRRVRLTADLNRNEATFQIRDEGKGYDRSRLPDPTDPANLCRIGGRGLLLIRTMVDDVQFNEKGNEITLIKRRLRDQP